MDSDDSPEIVRIDRQYFKCPKCNGKAVPIIYGYVKRIDGSEPLEENYVLGGCIHATYRPTYVCLNCGKHFYEKRYHEIQDYLMDKWEIIADHIDIVVDFVEEKIEKSKYKED